MPMNTQDKNKWIAVITAIVVLGGAIGGYVIYSKSSEVPQLETVSTTQQEQLVASTTLTSTTTMNLTSNQVAAPHTLPNGLIIQDQRIGTGLEAKAGNKIAVNYLGTLENGTKFDSSYDRKQAFTFTLGAGQVIQGWDEGFVGMKVGGKRKLIIPAALAYGNQAVGDVIPPNAILVFEVELVGVK